MDKLNLSVKRGEFEQLKKELKKVKSSITWFWIGFAVLAVDAVIDIAMVYNLLG